jgi:hypothetical protein
MRGGREQTLGAKVRTRVEIGKDEGGSAEAFQEVSICLQCTLPADDVIWSVNNNVPEESTC